MMCSQVPWQTQTEPKYRNNRKVGDSGHAPSSHHFKGVRGACWTFGMGLNQANMHKTNKQVGQHQVRAPLVLGRAMGDLVLIRFTTARIRGKPPPSPIQYTLHHSTGVASKWLFVPRLPNGSPKITKARSPTILRDYNFWCKPPIGTRSKPKLQPSSRASNDVSHATYTQGNWVDS